MAFLGAGKKCDLIKLATEMGETPADRNITLIGLKELITKSKAYEEDFIKTSFLTIISTRKEEEERELRINREEKELESKREERELEKMRIEAELAKANMELERLKIETMNTNIEGINEKPSISQPHFELAKIMPKYDVKEGDIVLYLALFERQAKRMKVEDKHLVSCLIPLMPPDIMQLMARIPEDEFENYECVKNIILNKFKLNAEAFRQKFCQHQRNSDKSWKDFVYEMKNYFEGWIGGLDVTDFEKLKQLIVADQVKKRVQYEIRNHFVDDWSKIYDPDDLAVKLDEYETVRKPYKTSVKTYSSSPQVDTNQTMLFSTKGLDKYEQDKTDKETHPQSREDSHHFQSKYACYFCGKNGHVKRFCPKLARENLMPENQNASSNRVAVDGNKRYNSHIKITPLTVTDDMSKRKPVVGKNLCKLERIPVSINGNLAEALIDSGTEITMVRMDVVKNITLENTATIKIKGIFGSAEVCPLINIPIAISIGDQTNVVHQEVLCAVATNIDEEVVMPPEIRDALKNIQISEVNGDLHEDDEKEEEKVTVESIEKPIMAEEVSVKPEDVDDWKNLMTLSKIYYVLEHPDSEGLPWKRRLKKKKIIRNFGDKDLIEWRVAQHFRLKSLEAWAAQRMEEQKMADKSPYDFDDLFEDDKSRDLQNIFEILETKKEKKRKIPKLAKILRRKRPFIFTGETVKDWTESYSDNSEESGADEMDEDALQIFEETDFKVGETPEPRPKVIGEESSISDESSISEIFSSFEEFKPYKDPKFDAIEGDTPIEVIYDICFDAVNEAKPKEKSIEEITSKKLKMSPSEKFALDEDSQADHLREVEVAQTLNNVVEQVDKDVKKERVFDKVIETEQIPDKTVEQVRDKTIENVVENVKKRVLFKESETEQDETARALGKIIDKKTMDRLAAERFDMSSEMTELEKLMDDLHLEETDDDEKQIGELTKELILKGTKSFIFEDTVEDKIEQKLKEAVEQSEYAKKTLDIPIPVRKLDEDSIRGLEAMEGYDDTKQMLHIQDSVQEVAEELFGKVTEDKKYDEHKQHVSVQDSVQDVAEAIIRKKNMEKRNFKKSELFLIQGMDV